MFRYAYDVQRFQKKIKIRTMSIMAPERKCRSKVYSVIPCLVQWKEQRSPAGVKPSGLDAGRRCGCDVLCNKCLRRN